MKKRVGEVLEFAENFMELQSSWRTTKLQKLQKLQKFSET
jgi:hypothetical protein